MTTVCQQCGGQIDPEKLAVLPTASYCLACANKMYKASKAKSSGGQRPRENRGDSRRVVYYPPVDGGIGYGQQLQLATVTKPTSKRSASDSVLREEMFDDGRFVRSFLKRGLAKADCYASGEKPAKGDLVTGPGDNDTEWVVVQYYDGYVVCSLRHSNGSTGNIYKADQLTLISNRQLQP